MGFVTCWDYEDFGNFEEQQTYYLIINPADITTYLDDEIVWNHPGLNPIAMEEFDDTQYPLDPTLNPTIYSFTMPVYAYEINPPPRGSSTPPDIKYNNSDDYISINKKVEISELIFTDDKQIGKVKSVDGHMIEWEDRETGKLHKTHKRELRFVKK